MQEITLALRDASAAYCALVDIRCTFQSLGLLPAHMHVADAAPRERPEPESFAALDDVIAAFERVARTRLN